jgi:sugar lactone lactonase YvrE
MKKILLAIGLFVFVQTAVCQLLEQPESIVFDAAGQRYIVSNTATSSMVSVDLDGEMKPFGTIGTGSHGLAIVGGKLYSCHKNVIHIHDLRDDAKIGEYVLTRAVFLNGLTSDGLNTLYATDFTKRKIYEISIDSDGDLSHKEIAITPKMPNGVAYDRVSDRLVVVTWGREASILAVDLSTRELSTLKETKFNNLESILIDAEGNMYITAWIPSNLLKFDADANELTEMNIFDVSNPTGLTFDKNGDLIVLSSASQKWTTVEVGPRADAKEIELTAFPNPMVTNSIISYTMKSEGDVTVCVYDARGKMVQQKTESKKGEGTHQFLLNRSDIPAGLYFVNLQTPSSSSAIPITITD